MFLIEELILLLDEVKYLSTFFKWTNLYFYLNTKHIHKLQKFYANGYHESRLTLLRVSHEYTYNTSGKLLQLLLYSRERTRHLLHTVTNLKYWSFWIKVAFFHNTLYFSIYIHRYCMLMSKEILFLHNIGIELGAKTNLVQSKFFFKSPLTAMILMTLLWTLEFLQRRCKRNKTEMEKWIYFRKLSWTQSNQQ